MRILQAETRRDALLGLFGSSLVRIPKRIQEMNVREFAANYGGSVQLVIEHEKKRAQGTLLLGETATMKKSAVKSAAKSKISAVAAQRTLQKNQIMATPLQTRSQSSAVVPGSTVRARQTPHGTLTGTPVITVAVGSHEKKIVDFSKLGAAEDLEAKDRDAAFHQLEKLQEKVTLLMEKLKQQA